MIPITSLHAKRRSWKAKVAILFRNNMPFMSTYNVKNWNNLIQDIDRTSGYEDEDQSYYEPQDAALNNQSNGHQDNRYQLEQSPNFTFADLAGTMPQEILDLLDFIQNNKKFKTFGINPPRGVLLVGPPGTGKTSIARAIAGEAHCGFINSSASEFIEIYIGTGPLHIRQLFDRARSYTRGYPDRKVIIFIDDIDAIGSRFAMAGHDTESRRTLNELLIQMDGFKQDDSITVLAATNDPHDIDPALKRAGRFDTIVEVPLPNQENRAAVLTHYIKKIPKHHVSPTIDRDLLASKTRGFNNADLKELVRVATLNAARKEATMVTQDHLEQAIGTIRKQKRY